MRFSSVLPVLVALAALAHVSSSHAEARTRAVGRAAEVRRIQAHFDSALTELASRDLSYLTPAQREARAALMATLRAYRDRGVFPRNYDFPGRAMPYFVDRRTGVLCAVAHLLESSGRRDLVDRVAAMDNNVWVPELAGDTAFTAWLDVHGITLAEAARIQVPYVDDGSPIVSALGSRTAVYGIGSAIAIGGAAATAIWNGGHNASGRRTLGNVLGVATGMLALGFGAAASTDEGAPPAVGALSLAVGGLSTFLSSRGFVRHQRLVASERRATREREAARVSVAPMLPISRRGGTGLAVRVAF